MLNQQSLLDAARVAIAEREGKPEPVTHYRVCKELGLTTAYMTQLTKGQCVMSAEVAHKLAALAGIDPAYAMACIEAERAQHYDLETTGTWRALAFQLSGRAASILLAVCLAAGTVSDARASENAGISRQPAPTDASRSLYIKSSRRRRRNSLAAGLRALLHPPPLLAIA